MANNLEQGAAVDFLYKKQLICWSEQIAELIQCMKYNDTYIGEKVSELISYSIPLLLP